MSAVLPTEAQCWQEFWETAGPILHSLGPHRGMTQRINSVGALDMVPEFESAAEALRADRYEVWVGQIAGEEKAALVALREDERTSPARPAPG